MTVQKIDTLQPPEEQINFRYAIAAQTTAELHYRVKDPGMLTAGFIHFPPGCQALVRVRVMVGRKKGSEAIKITPIDDQYIALDDANYSFNLNQKVYRGDNIIIQLGNYDKDNPHTITVLLSKVKDLTVVEG